MTWVRNVTDGPGKIKYLIITSLGDREIIISSGTPLALWMPADMIPVSPVYMSVGSGRYKEWQTLEFEASV